MKPLLSARHRATPPMGYLGVGFGLRALPHTLAERGLRAFRTVGFDCCNRDGSGDVPHDDPDWIASRLRIGNAIVVVLKLPDNPSGPHQMDEAAQARCMDLLEMEYELGCEIRRASGEQGASIATASLRRGDRRQEVIFLAPERMDLVGYTNQAVHERFRDFDARVRESRRQPHQFTDAELEQRICAALFRKLPNLAEAKVMISSTGLDCGQEHRVVSESLKMLGQRTEAYQLQLHPLSYLDRPVTEDSLPASYNLVDQSTFYLGLLKDRMGEPKLNDRSLTEIEYDRAYETGKQSGFFIGDPGKYTTREADQHATPGERERRQAFLERIDRRGTPRCFFGSPDDLRTRVFEMLNWMNRPSPDQQALPPPNGASRWKVYVAHPYVLMESQFSVRRSAWNDRFDSWLGTANGPGIFLLRALGGMGKSAVTWSWFTRLQEQTGHPAVMWWSFYARNSGPAQFAYHALWWLMRDPVTAARLHEAGDHRALYRVLLRELEDDGRDFLFCLDGIERVLVAYQSFRDEVAPDEGPTLDLTLQQTAHVQAATHGVAESQAMRYLLKFVGEERFESSGAEGEAIVRRVQNREDGSAFAWFLSEAVKLKRVKFLITSRFTPTVVSDLAEGPAPAAVVEELTGLTPGEARALWEGDGSEGLIWEDDQLPEELGGGTLAEICCDSLGGYALAVSMLAELVATEEKWEGRFSAWKASQFGPVRNGSWRAAAGTAVDRANHAAQLQSKILLLTLERIRREPGDWEVLAAIMLGNGGASSFADLFEQFVGPDKRFKTYNGLHAALTRLRKWKIIGASPEMDKFDAHPVMRRALKEYDPDNDPATKSEATRLLDAWRTDDAGYDLRHEEVPFEVLSRRWEEVLGYANMGAAGLAFELYEEGIENRLRYLTQSEGIVASRGRWLREAIDVLDQFILIKQSEPLRVFSGLLKALLADNLLLEGKITEGLKWITTAGQPDRNTEYKTLPNPGAAPLAEGSVLPAIWLMRARTSLERGHLLSYQAQRGDSFEAYQDAIIDAIKVCSSKDASPHLRRSADRIVEWSLYNLAVLAIDMGMSDYAGYIARHFPAPGSDADADYARLKIAMTTGDDVATRLDHYREACNLPGNRLNLGNVSLAVVTGLAMLRHGVEGEVPLRDLLEEVEDVALSQGFTLHQCEAALLRLEEGTSRLPHMAKSGALAIAAQASLDGNVVLEAEARLVAARAMLALTPPDISGVREQAGEAFRLAWGDGVPWVGGTLQDRAARACEAAGLDWRQVAKGLIRTARVEWDEAELKRKAEAARMAQQPGQTPRPRNITDTSEWAAEQIDQAIEGDKAAHLGWAETTGTARMWWEAFEQENESRRALIYRLIEELRNRKATITDFFLAYVYSNTDNIQANLHYLDYTTLKKEVEASDDPRIRRWNYRLLEDWTSALDLLSEEEARARFPQLENSLGLADATGGAIEWWEAFKAEKSDHPRDLTRLAGWLAENSCSVSDLWVAALNANTGNVQAILCYLLYSRLKSQSESQQQEHEAEARRIQEAQDRARAEALIAVLGEPPATGEQAKAPSASDLAWLRDHLPETISPEERSDILSRLDEAQHDAEAEETRQAAQWEALLDGLGADSENDEPETVDFGPTPGSTGTEPPELGSNGKRFIQFIRRLFGRKSRGG